MNEGFTFASFHGVGNSPDIILLFTMKVMLGVITLADNLRIFGPILSIPVDWFRFNVERKLSTKSRLSGQLEIQYS